MNGSIFLHETVSFAVFSFEVMVASMYKLNKQHCKLKVRYDSNPQDDFLAAELLEAKVSGRLCQLT